LRPWREHGWLTTEAAGGLIIRDITSIQSHAHTQT
jgi:hypothetical protein